MRKLKIGIVGLGRGAAAGALVMEQSRNVEITAICDCNEEVLQKRAASFSAADAGRSGNDNSGAKFSGPAYVSYEEMLKKADIEAVYAATPIPCHADHCCMALNAGKHVLSEVTALADMRDCARLQEAVKSSGKKYMLAENYCYLRPWSIAMGMVKAGLFGEIYYAEGDYLMDFTERHNYPYIGGWRQNVYYMHRGHVYITHSLGPLMMLFNEPVKKVCCVGSGQHPRGWGLRADNNCNLLLKTESGKSIHLRQDFLSPRPDNFLYYGFQGTKGAYEGTKSLRGVFVSDIKEGDHRVYIKGLCKSGEWRNLEDFASDFLPEAWKAVPPEKVDNGYNGGVPMMFDDFAQAIFDDRETFIPIETSLNWTAAGLLSEQSADQDGMPVNVPDFR
ncbi:MAG: Gfo/Idh/MocA family oxidoreductase [Victivallales bacterium]|nr:Gfo/Idh/MocA family oxidoreductase [Victivallales bacterium]